MALRGSPALVGIFLLGCLALVFWGGRRNDQFLYLAGFLVPFIGLGFSFFTNIYWALYIFPLALVTIVVQRKRDITWRDIAGRESLALFLAYVFYITLIRAVLDYTATSPRYLKAAAYGWGIAQSTYRYPVQFLSFVFAWGALFVGFWFVRERRDVLAVIKGYVDANVLNALVGLYQIAAYRWRLPWPSQILDPAGRSVDILASRMSVRMTGITLHRLSGFGGEPKHTASSLALAIVLVLCLKIFAPNIALIRHSKYKLLIMFLALFFTFSTSGWVSILCVGAYLLVSVVLHGKLQTLGYIVFVFGTVLAIVSFLGGGDVLQDVYRLRIVERLSGGLDEIAQEEARDPALIRYALDNPLDMILGHGTGGIDFWLMETEYLETWVTTRSSTVTPSYLPTRLLGDIGVVGLLLLGVLGQQWNQKFRERNLEVYRQFLIMGALALAFANSLSLPGYLLLCGSMIAYACRTEDSEKLGFERVGENV